MEQEPQQGHGLVHDAKEFRIRVTEDRTAHGLKDAGMKIARSGPEQHPRFVGQLAVWQGFAGHAKSVQC